jgi:hypothetical protein
MEKTASSASSSAAPVVNTAKVKNIGGEIFGTFLGFFKKPVETIKNTYTKFNKDAKSAWIFAGVGIVAAMLIQLITSILDAIIVHTSKSTKIDFDMLKDFDWWAAIWQPIVVFAIVVAVIAGIAQLFTLIFKGKANFVSTAGVAVMPIVYSALCSFVLVIASKIFSSSSSDFDFVTVLSFFASAFFYITLFAGLFYATDLEGDKKFWYMFLTYAVVQVCFYIIFSFIVKDLATPALKTGLPILQDAGASAAVNNAVKSTLDSLKSLF